MTDDLVRTVGEMLRVVTPALREILTEQERAATTLTPLRDASTPGVMPVFDEWPVLGEDEPLADDVLLLVRTFDDRHMSWMQGCETARELRARFRSELQDFVAESTFGWGRLRP